MKRNRILCVIIHFRDIVLTWNCVTSALKKNKNVDIVIVDNDIQQDFEIIALFQNQVKLVRTGGYAGFSAANNLGVKKGLEAHHYAILLLNNDTVVVDYAIQKMASLLQDKFVGLVGPCMLYLDHPDKIWACGGFVSKLKVQIGAIQHTNNNIPFEVDYLPGAAILCTVDLWNKTEGLSEKYFLGYEEAELALQIKKLGFRIMVHPEAVILHKVGMSSERKPKYDYNDIRNRMKFGRYLWGWLGTLWVVAITLRSTIVNRAKLSLWYLAVMDELKKVPLDHHSLSKIETKYMN